ncbi:winged helix DNA-binding domain-containing protein [Streptomyces sp. TRM64462]|uniref:winged helix DNA-binding domain-containing protein n=1 Tax=Streptomyces sp. TRM64462 TaxID=2741726 RepID=UPI0015867DDC|nr:winged helix DNA-binding domain-containing protein [Streptomyces sp. TRM64462]
MVSTDSPVLSLRALNRATLARQLLLSRTRMSAEDAVRHLVGLQAQNTKPPYYALAARLDGFRPEELSGLMERREAARTVTMRSTLHTHTAEDVLGLGPLMQPARDREVRAFRKGLDGVDLDALTALTRELVEERPRTPKEIRTALLARWPDADPLALGVTARCLLPLVQVTPRGLWNRSGQVALTTADVWFRGFRGSPRPAPAGPAPAGPAPAGPAPEFGLESVVVRYLLAFGPASVKDMQTWSGLTRLRDTFERLRPRLLTFRDPYGTELFDLPDAPRPDPDTPAPPRFLPEFDNLLLSHADRSRVVPPAFKDRTWQGNQAYRTFLADGLLAGIWALEEAKGGSLTMTVQPFGTLSREQRAAVADEAALTLETLGGGASYDVRFGAVAG